MEGSKDSKHISKSHSEVGIALFGLGNIGTIHLDNLRKNQRARIIYCIEESEERVNYLQNLWKLQESGTIFLKPEEKDKVFNDKRVDAVIICTPTFTHEELVLKSLESGKAVFCEKPLALSVEGIEKCLDAVKKFSKPLQTGFNRRFDPGLRKVKTSVDAGEIGKVHVIKTCSRDPPKHLSTEALKLSGGIFHDTAVHDIDVICWILSEYPENVSVYAHANFEDIKEIGDYDTVVIMMKFPSGTIATIDLSRHAVYGYDQRIEVFGNKGMLTNGEQRPTGVQFHNEKGTTAVPIFFSFASRYQESYKAEMEHFLNVCQGLEECEVTPESVLAVSKIATACEQVVNSGKSLALDLDRVPNGY